MPEFSFNKPIKINKYSQRESYDNLNNIPKSYGNIKETIYKNYYVTDKGYVISQNIQSNKYIILKPSYNGDYLHIILIVNGKRKSISVHRLILQTFNPIDNSNNYQVNHIDENKDNNCLENLEWCTAQFNTEYSQAKQINCWNIRTNEFIGTFNSTHEAARQLGLLQGEIVNVLKRRRNQKHTKGYTFEYV